MKDKDLEFDFYIGGNESNQEEFEDVFSNSSAKSGGNGDEISLSSFAGGAHSGYSKKSHGFFGKFKSWWKGRKGWQKGLLISTTSFLLVFVIAFSVLWGTGILSLLNYNYNDITEDTEELGFENVLNENIVNIALFGLDTRNLNSFKGNSDSIMILSLNTNTKKVKIISVMRDSFVPITYNGKTTYSKINSAYSKGGPELAIKVLNTNFGLDISEYATVNFYGMVDIIDAVGGIEAELTKAEVATISQNMYALNACIKEISENMGKKPNEHYITKPGVHHLNGIQAVAYSRIRYVANIWGTNNDYGRTDRQRYVMEQLFNKALTLEKTQYIKLAKSLIPCSETSLSYSEIIGLAFDILLKSPTFSQARMPQQEFLMPSPKTSAGSVVYYDLEFAKTLIHSYIYDDITFEDYIAEHGIQKNNWYKGGSSSVKNPVTSNSSSQSGNTSSDGSDRNDPDVSDTPSEGNSSNSSDLEEDGTSSKPSVGDDEDDKTSKPSDGEDEDGESGGSSDEEGSETNKPADGEGDGDTTEKPSEGEENKPDTTPDSGTGDDNTEN